ncbi:MAG: LptF/LptG family permease [Alphaproteobacteria bacterium]
MTILSKYISKRFLATFIGLSAGLMLLVFLIDSIETAYRLSRKDNTQPLDALGLSILKMPGLYEQILPFAILLTAVMVFRRLSLDSEIDVIRSIGVSAWRFLMPLVLVSFVLGTAAVTLLNPVSVKLNTLYELREVVAKGEADSEQSIIQNNSWIRDKVGDNYYMLSIGKVIPLNNQKDQLKIINGNIRVQNQESELLQQILFKNAIISENNWQLSEVTEIDYKNQTTQNKNNLVISTNLPAAELIERAISPEFLTFWQLPKTIKVLQKAGLSTSHHWLYFLNKIAQPFLFVSLAILGAVLALRPSRRGGGYYVILASIISGFIIWSFSSIVFSLGLEGNIPILIAAWLPAIIALMVAISLILYREDG